MSSRLQDSALENIARDKGQKFIQEAQADHWVNEMHRGHPGWWSSHVSGLFRRLAGALKGHEIGKEKRLPNAKLRGHPHPSH